MKSFASLILALALILTLTACAGTPAASVPPSAPESPAPSSKIGRAAGRERGLAGV